MYFLTMFDQLYKLRLLKNADFKIMNLFQEDSWFSSQHCFIRCVLSFIKNTLI